MFKEYTHLERLGTTEVENITLGTCHIFPKIDGTNASVWWDNGVEAGSRKRHLSADADNAGFFNWAREQVNLFEFLNDHRNLTLYGEWLVPHSFKDYRDDAWRQFYIFDVYNNEEDLYVPYDQYQPLLEQYALEYLAPLAVVNNPDHERLLTILEQNRYLVKDSSERYGEGIVIKNYDFTNNYHRSCFAKLVSTQFKEDNAKVFHNGKVNEGKAMVEEAIVDKYVTRELCDKVLAKIEDFSSKNIPQYLNTVFYDLIREETWEFIKANKNPTVNFGTLQALTYRKAKEHQPQIFGV